MLYPRIIPCLLMKNFGLVKTLNFENPKYVGDPINAVKIFNEKEVDELLVLDIDATVNNYEPNYNLVEKLAVECRMPLCYGGGIKNTDQAMKILSLGVEKVAISSEAISNPTFICDIVKRVGRQSIVVVLDVVQHRDGKYYVKTHNGKKSTNKDVIELAMICEEIGAGEIVVNSIDNDGKMKGYDLDLFAKVRGVIDIPLTMLGGAGSLNDIGALINKYGIVGASAGSLFVFKGKYKAVLINYPSPAEKEKLIKMSFPNELKDSAL